ncbi:hypothetical protein CH92_04400 [Stutzerimonas stutzeri]|uniref:TRAP transporter small permease protein n=1 Tax=Stutzerimonas stutzeri TaxID=316 RepID=W8R3W9_STUST|nr:TRAP transporter small permease subunit [Stutzerimonas stutzeri]AHL77615.1 hypothetical protein CH92_04400 [Stutzerimonas stutzeri]MCQ4328891.1 TRAP transporter small permease subunit [Stutzerimonas stutzeri]
MKKILYLMGQIDRTLMFVIKPVVAILSVFVAVLLVVGIFTRSVLEKPVFGLEELVLLAAMWLYMFGAAIASRDRSHLSADFVQVVCSNKSVVRFFHLLATVISLIMAILFARWSFDLMSWSLSKVQTSTVLKIPWYVSQSSLFFGSVLFIFYLLRDFLNDLASFQSRHEIHN